MAGYSRQSVADIISGEVVKAAPLNAEFNALRDAFAFATGHVHDGSSTSGAYIGLIADTDGKNKVVVDTSNNRVSFYVEVSGSAVEQIRVQDGAIVPVTDDDVDLGASGLEFKNLYIDGTANLDALVSAAVTITGGSIDGTTIGQTTPAAIAGTTIGGTVITASTQFTGDVVGNVTGNSTGNLTGDVTGNVTGNLTGNVTSSGTSTFSNVTISGTLNMDAGTTATIQNLATPSNAKDAAPKDYVDTADALKLNLSGGTMSGNIAMGTNKVTGLGTPSASADAATKGYVDTSVSNLVDSAPAALDTLNELAAALGDDANFSTTITNSIATKLPLAGGTMSGAIAMGTSKITGLGDPASAQDAATKTYVDTADALKLNLSGGTMTGDITMGANKVTSSTTPSADSDLTRKAYVDTQDATKLNLSGGTMTGNIVLGANKATSTATPTGNDDLTRKAYVDGILGSATAAATSATNAANSATAAATSATNAATSASNAATSATNAASSFDSFDDRYLGAKSSQPATDNDGDALITGALYFDSTANEVRVYDGNSWVAAGSAVNGTSVRETYTATASQTTFNVIYDVGSPSFVDVYLNGVKLLQGTDFTATSGTNIVLTTGATVGDIVDIVAFGAFSVANTYTQAQSNARFAQLSNNLSDLASAPTARTNLGLGTAATNNTGDFLQPSNNLSDVSTPATALTNLGLTATAAEVNILDGATVTTAELNILDGATVTTAELNTLDGYTGAVADLNRIDITTEGTSEASKVVTADSNGVVTFDNGKIEEVTAITSSSNAATLNLRDGDNFTHILTENVTYTFSNPAASGKASAFTLKVVQNSGASGYTITWPSSVDWVAATAPTLTATANAVDYFVFITTDGGTNYYGFVAGQALA